MIVDGYYNHQLVKITFSDDKIKLGTKIINAKDIYATNQEYITDYSIMYPPAFVITSVVLSTLLSIIFTSEINLLVFILSSLFGFTYSYFIYKPKLRNLSNNEYSMLYDIILKTTHYSVLLKPSDVYEIKQNYGIQHTYWQKRVLKKYIKRIHDSRKYLFTQIETGKWKTYNDLYEKYVTVSKVKYSFSDNSLSNKQVNIIIENYLKLNSSYIKNSFKLIRFSIIMIVVIIVYMFI